MITETFVRLPVCALGLLIALPSSGYAGHVLYHGSLCNPEAGSTTLNLVQYDQFGVSNVGSSITTTNTSAPVSCGAAIEDSSTVQAVTVVVYDRNMTDDVVCTLTLVDRLGIGTPVAAQSSSGQQATEKTLVLTPPTTTTSATIYLRCLIPPFVPGGPGGGGTPPAGASYVTTYGVTTTP
jgi:hypothetical protein